jgi:hypothetical protein
MEQVGHLQEMYLLEEEKYQVVLVVLKQQQYMQVEIQMMVILVELIKLIFTTVVHGLQVLLYQLV